MRPLLIFYILVIYILVQFCWWAYLLVDLNREVYKHKVELLELTVKDDAMLKAAKDKSRTHLHQKWLMIAGEGFVFLSLLLTGIFLIWKSFTKEIYLAKRQKNFLLSVTHEFKSPLAAVKLNLQTMQRHKLDEEAKLEIIKNAVYETDRLNEMVDNILKAARIETHNLDLQKTEFNLSSCIRESLRSKIQHVEEPGQIMLDIEDDVNITGDPLAIASVLLNLVDNAEKYADKYLDLEISLRQNNTQAILKVKDHGIGIPGDEKKKIFEKFYRVGSEETRKTKGTGLGLYIVKHIVAMHNGTVNVTDNKPKGTVFEIVFPKSSA